MRRGCESRGAAPLSARRGQVALRREIRPSAKLPPADSLPLCLLGVIVFLLHDDMISDFDVAPDVRPTLPTRWFLSAV